jgi:hypothetical protein
MSLPQPAPHPPACHRHRFSPCDAVRVHIHVRLRRRHPRSPQAPRHTSFSPSPHSTLSAMLHASMCLDTLVSRPVDIPIPQPRMRRYRPSSVLPTSGLYARRWHRLSWRWSSRPRRLARRRRARPVAPSGHASRRAGVGTLFARPGHVVRTSPVTFRAVPPLRHRALRGPACQAPARLGPRVRIGRAQRRGSPQPARRARAGTSLDLAGELACNGSFDTTTPGTDTPAPRPARGLASCSDV